MCEGCPASIKGHRSKTLEFDHCRKHPEVVDVGSLPGYPRRRCVFKHAGCLDDVFNLSESQVYIAAGIIDQHTPWNAVANTVAFLWANAQGTVETNEI